MKTTTASPSPAASDAPAASPTPKATVATATPPAVSLEIEVGQMLMAGFDGTTLSEDAVHIMRDLHVGNVILMGHNIESPAQVLALTQQLQKTAMKQNGIGLLVATDQEGGSVQRLNDGFTRLPDALTVGNVGKPDLTEKLGAMAGSEMAAVGVNLDFAPDLDVNDNPANPVIGPRAFGSTPAVVVAQGPAFAAGLRSAGVIAVGKHFPGHGNTSQNSHFELPVVNKTVAQLNAVELPPFVAAIEQGIDGLMAAHVAYPALDPSGLPATVSAPILGQLLRGDLNYKGLVFTDDMGMKGIADVMSLEDASVKAIDAGADVLLCVRMTNEDGSCPPEYIDRMQAALLAAVKDGRLTRTRVDESYQRVLALKQKSTVGPASGAGLATVGDAAHEAVVAAVVGGG
ncbi:MAG: beta-N-acetylhexosaminidase [Tepidiformaceae bacterium]